MFNSTGLFLRPVLQMFNSTGLSPGTVRQMFNSTGLSLDPFSLHFTCFFQDKLNLSKDTITDRLSEYCQGLSVLQCIFKAVIVYCILAIFRRRQSLLY